MIFPLCNQLHISVIGDLANVTGVGRSPDQLLDRFENQLIWINCRQRRDCRRGILPAGTGHRFACILRVNQRASESHEKKDRNDLLGYRTNSGGNDEKIGNPGRLHRQAARFSELGLNFANFLFVHHGAVITVLSKIQPRAGRILNLCNAGCGVDTSGL